MCGIGGKISFSDNVDPDIANAMNQCMLHRGPDMSGVYANGPVVLAHRRLSIIDTSDAGRQPMSNDDGSVHIVFNGEIYNYLELRSFLGGYQFHSDSDTEVLLHIYEELGTECLNKLRGMFAFAIWDENENQLFLARDRLGQKPLFYRHTTEGFWFGSTIPALLADPAVTPAPDLDAIRSYLNFQYVPSPETGFKTIKQLKPGTALTLSIDGELSEKKYWSLSYTEKEATPPDKIAGRILEKLREATKLRMRTDVPLGAFLSGGIDSSIVVALLSELAEEPANTYSIGFDIENYDELEHARTVAEEFGTEHTEQTVSAESLLNSASDLVTHYGMPFGDTSALPSYHVSRLASEDITVAMSGDAGDENFAGYKRYDFDAWLNRLNKIPKWIRTGVRAGVERVPPPWYSQKSIRWPRKALEYADYKPDIRYPLLVCHAHGEEIERFWSPPSPADEFSPVRAPLVSSDGPTRLDRLLHTDMQTYLPDDILVKVDRASMAHSIEVRSPYLDHELVELAARIPAKYKRRHGTSKWILKKAFRDVLPDKIIDRNKKGFGVPVNEWFRGKLRSFARERLNRLGERPAFTSPESVLDEHIAGEAKNGNQIWDLVMLEEWYQQYIDRA